MKEPVSLDASAWAFLRKPEQVASELMKGAPASATPPAHLMEAQVRAKELGIDLNAVLAQDAAALKARVFPTAECLSAAEVELYSLDPARLSAAKRAHPQTCPFCERVLAASKPSEEQVQRFMDEVGSMAARASVKAAREDVAIAARAHAASARYA